MSYIGDILHATPAARWIKEHYPEAKLHWIVTPTMAEILRHNPYVDEIIEWERDAQFIVNTFEDYTRFTYL